MSGHSKWSKVKHQKAVTDAVKGKIFTKLSNAIINAVISSGRNPDPDTNFKLRLIVERSRHMNMPKDKIEHAIARAVGDEEAVVLQEAIYEGFGPSGVGILIEVLTDNKQRTVVEIKNVLERGGGNLATAGAVSHLFQHVGLITVDKKGKLYDMVMEDAIQTGAIDIKDESDGYEIFTLPTDLHKIKIAMEDKEYTIVSSELIFRPTITIPFNDHSTASQILKLIESLEEMDDVQKVFCNFDIPLKLMTVIT